MGEYIVPKILNHDLHIFQDKNGRLYEPSVYIFCADTVKHSQWAYDFLELNCIQMERDEPVILACLTRGIANYLAFEGEELLAEDRIASLNRVHQYFSWTRTLHLQAESVWKGVSRKPSWVNSTIWLVMQNRKFNYSRLH